MSEIITARQLAHILGVNELTVNHLARSGLLPAHIPAQGSVLFDAAHISSWLKAGALHTIAEPRVHRIKHQWEAAYAPALKTIRTLERGIAPPRGKGYCLSKVPNKRHGFLYYVRYSEHGHMIPSRYNTHTTDLALAHRFAVENRHRIITRWHERQHPNHRLYDTLKGYYAPQSPWLEKDQRRGRFLGSKTRSVYHHFIHKVFIPFLRRSGIEKVTDITATVLFRFQDYLLAKGNKPQTVNSALSCIRVIFDRFVLDGVVTENVVSALPQVKIRTGDHYVRGCYDLADLKGVFNKPWGDPASFLLCLLIYTTGMRNSEIEKLQLQHIIELDGIRLIRIPESKTDNGVRVVPLHPFTWRALRSWAKQTGKTEGDYLFSLHGGPNQSTLYRKANQDMGLVLRLSESDLAERHITFYSGRHFYKTLLDAEGLGDIEEYFMGHKVSKDVAKRYNHRDKQGMDKIVKKAGEVFRALDRRLFRQKP